MAADLAAVTFVLVFIREYFEANKQEGFVSSEHERGVAFPLHLRKGNRSFEDREKCFRAELLQIAHALQTFTDMLLIQ
jgi:hypothetical protein